LKGILNIFIIKIQCRPIGTVRLKQFSATGGLASVKRSGEAGSAFCGSL